MGMVPSFLVELALGHQECETVRIRDIMTHYDRLIGAIDSNIYLS